VEESGWLFECASPGFCQFSSKLCCSMHPYFIGLRLIGLLVLSPLIGYRNCNTWCPRTLNYHNAQYTCTNNFILFIICFHAIKYNMLLLYGCTDIIILIVTILAILLWLRSRRPVTYPPGPVPIKECGTF
jgi:hypothetical protein